MAVDLATVTAKGGLSALDVRATAMGSQAGQPLALDSVATLDLSGTRKTVRVAQLSGKAAGQPFNLGQLATVTLDGPAVAVDRLDLGLYGPARVQGGLVGASRIAGDLTLAALPLASLRPFGAPPLDGTLQAKLNLSGTRKEPEAHLDASMTKLALDRASKVKTDAQLGADLRGGRLEATATATGLGSAPLTTQLGLPATFGLDPPAFRAQRNRCPDEQRSEPVDLARGLPSSLPSPERSSQAASNPTSLSPAPCRHPQLDDHREHGSVQDVASGCRPAATWWLQQ